MANLLAGVVLAGGQSSRMGTNKALLLYRGVPMVEYMQWLLKDAGCEKVFISGTVQGYDSIADQSLHQGPAFAMCSILRHYFHTYDRILFVPVDMPLLRKEDLQKLTAQRGSVFYKNHPLPAVVKSGRYVDKEVSVRGLLQQASAVSLDTENGQEERMYNANTPEEWRKIAT